MAEILPAIFFGHGNPMNALLKNPYTEAWRGLGRTMPKPNAVLAISAHWYVPETGVTVTTAPKTIHDFGGFPAELYQVRYPAPGDPRIKPLYSFTMQSARSVKFAASSGVHQSRRLPDASYRRPASSKPCVSS